MIHCLNILNFSRLKVEWLNLVAKYTKWLTNLLSANCTRIVVFQKTENFSEEKNWIADELHGYLIEFSESDAAKSADNFSELYDV